MSEPTGEGAPKCPPHNVIEGAPQRDPKTGKVRIFKCKWCGNRFAADELTDQDMEDGTPFGEEED